MSDLLLDIVSGQLGDAGDANAASSRATLEYLDRLSSLSLSSLTSTEPEALQHDSQSLLRSLQALSKRSYKSIDLSNEALDHLQHDLPHIVQSASRLQTNLPGLDGSATRFAEKYNRLTENALLDRRKRVMKLGENVDRLSSILELPTLLSSIISASSASAAPAVGPMSSASANYATALDLHAHIRRLQRLYPESELIKSIATPAEAAMRDMTSNLIVSLRSQSLKLAGGMRLIGLLRRVAPELDEGSANSKAWTATSSEGSLGAMFLVCRLSNLMATLEALEPLQELAEQEFRQPVAAKERNAWAAGQQTERYLKRYVEVFREQCFAIISMYKSIFPTSLPGPTSNAPPEDEGFKFQPPALRSTSGQQGDGHVLAEDPLQKLPPAVATFTFYVIDLLMETLRRYLPNVRDRGSRDSLLTQVLYCSASLGRLGGDFSLMLSLLEEDMDDADGGGEAASEPEWLQAMRKHRVQSGRLELLASGAMRPSNKDTLAAV